MAENESPYARGPSLADIAAATLQPAPTSEAEQQDEERTDQNEQIEAEDDTEEILDASSAEEAESGSEGEEPTHTL